MEERDIEKDSKLIEFREKFESLAEEYNIQKYILIYDDPDDEKEKLAVLYRPEDVMEITRILKNSHNQFFRQVMIRVGETS